MKSLYENITDTEYTTLNSILENPNSTPADFFFDEPTIDGQIEELVRTKFVEFTPEDTLLVTELGRTALMEHEKILKERKSEHYFRLIQFLVPTFISIAALVVSIIALTK